MKKYYCDLCKSELKYDIVHISVDFPSSEGYVKYNLEYHKQCWSKIINDK